MGDRRGSYRVFVRRANGKDHLENLSMDGRIILRWIFSKWDGEAWTGLTWLRTGTGGGPL
jgi:hypothetical protein